MRKHSQGSTLGDSSEQTSSSDNLTTASQMAFDRKASHVHVR